MSGFIAALCLQSWTMPVSGKHLQMFKHEIALKGSAYLQKPGRFAWHTKTPVRNSIVLKDTKVFQWNEEVFR